MIRKGMFISDRYEIIEKVGSGGMSDVYKAKCHKLNRFVAMKVLKPEFCEDKSFVSKFRVEAQSAAGLTHPNIVNVYDVGDDNGIYYIVMELIEGITLKKYIEKKGKLQVKEAVSIAVQVAQGIEAAHNNHIIHRDIKPQNIIISREGKVKVTDFGIAKAASANTINGNAMGSVHYISPEQAKGAYIDEKSDIYSLGITLYEMITGQVPFEGDSTVSVALQHLNEEIPNPKLVVPDLPISVEKIIEKCTQKKPERRYLKVSSLIADLKKSLVSPDEDFVQLVPNTIGGTTVLISEDEVSVIRKEANQADNKYNTSSLENVDDLTDDDDAFGNDDDIDSVNPKLDKVIAIGGIITLIVVIILVALLVSKSLGGCGSDEGENPTTNNENPSLSDKETIVPNVVGLTEKEAEDALNDKSLGFKVSERVNDNTVPKGKVISQSKDAGDIVDKNSKVEVVISDGPKAVTVPSVKDKTKEEAAQLLTGDEYKFVVKYEYATDKEIEAEHVIKTVPSEGTAAKAGDDITVYISQGADTSDVVMIDIKGKTQAEAKTALTELGLTLKVLKEEYNDSVASGKIISQDIASDKTVPRGTEIGVVISKGTKPTEKPTEPESTTPAQPVASFRLIKESDLTLPMGEDIDGNPVTVETGTLSAKITYIGANGTSSISDPYELEKTTIPSWSQSSFSIKKPAKPGSDVTLEIWLEYTTYESGKMSDKKKELVYTNTVAFSQ